MLTILLFLILLSSGSIFASAYFDTRYEEIIPITSISFILTAYIFGIFNILKYSSYVVVATAILMYVLAINKTIRANKFKQILKNTFTPGFFIFVVFCLIFVLGTKGKLFNLNDEFSHWGDIVKVMVDIEDFGTNPNSGSLFKSYPPAMAIFQYILQRINYIVTRKIFAEWLCYYAYDILCVIVLLPLFAKIKYKNITSIIAIIAIIFCLPCIYFESSFISLHIEIFLAFLICSFGLQMLFFDNSTLAFVRMLLLLAIFPIVKDSGLLFGGLFAIAFIILYLSTNINATNKKKIISVIIIAASVTIPKLLWEFDIKVNNAARSFSNKFDFKSLINVITGNEISYRKDVFSNFIDEMVGGHITFGLTTKIPHFALIGIVIFLVIIVTSLVLSNKKASEINIVITRITMILIATIFIIGMCISYMYKFSEEEALVLASFLRYISTIYLSFSLFIFLGFVLIINDLENETILNSIIICTIMFLTQFGFIVSFGFGTSAETSQQIRNDYYQKIVDKTNNVAHNSKIWFIEIEENSEDRLVYKYCVRPNMVDGDWSIRTELKEDDSYSVIKTLSEWRNELIMGDYNYVALFTIDGTFTEQYALMFEKPEDIHNMCIYIFNSDTGLLSLCE